MILVGDTLFMPDVGTARCDFPGGNAHQMFTSIHKLLAFPASVRLYVCHDYPPEGREPRSAMTTVGEQRKSNIHVRDGIDEAAFVDMRTKRDAGLGMPTLLLPAIQVNVRAGNLPPAEDNGVLYLKSPIEQTLSRDRSLRRSSCTGTHSPFDRRRRHRSPCRAAAITGCASIKNLPASTHWPATAAPSCTAPA